MKSFKLFLSYSLFSLFILFTLGTTAQVIDLSTGVAPSSTLIPYGSADDTWTVCFPGSNPALPSSYLPAYSTNAIPTGYGSSPYIGLDPAVTWISPGVSGAQPSYVPMGDYYYKMTFDLDPACEVSAAVFNFATIGGDDQINQIIVNGNIHVVAYGFNPLASSISLPIPNTDLVSGTNTILIRVYNWGNSIFLNTPAGMQINGNLTITSGPNPSFCATAPTSSTLIATSGTSGSHTWEIYSSSTGNAGTYFYIGTFNYDNLYLSGAGPCYLIKHTVSNQCGTACFSQSVCYQPCDVVGPQECTDLTAPTHLTYNSSTNLFSWTPVPGAISYDIEIIVNDPECCRGEFLMAPRVITTATNTYVINWADQDIDGRPDCFSWRVIAKCPNGNSVSSAKQCGFPWSGSDYDDKNPNAIKTGGTEERVEDGNTSVALYPNPAKGVVSINISTQNETVFTISIDNMDGKTVKTFDKLKTTANKYTLKWNTESVAKGSYLIKIMTSDGHILVKKLLVE